MKVRSLNDHGLRNELLAAVERGEAIYCGRQMKGFRLEASWLANPFSARIYGHDDCMKRYRKFLHQQLKDDGFKAKLLALPEDATLVCWCVNTDDPCDDNEVCHCQILAKARRYLKQQHQVTT